MESDIFGLQTTNHERLQQIQDIKDQYQRQWSRYHNGQNMFKDEERMEVEEIQMFVWITQASITEKQGERDILKAKLQRAQKALQDMEVRMTVERAMEDSRQ